MKNKLVFEKKLWNYRLCFFPLKLLIDFYLKSKKKKRFCAFVDYRKAFDSVIRLHLWRKLLSHNIDGKCLKVIHNMYDNAKSCVKVNNVLTDFFSSFFAVVFVPPESSRYGNLVIFDKHSEWTFKYLNAGYLTDI